jgi:hypothetical protein
VISHGYRFSSQTSIGPPNVIGSQVVGYCVTAIEFNRVPDDAAFAEVTAEDARVLDVEMLEDEKPHAVLLVQRDQAGADVVDTAAFADIGLVPWI